MTPNKKIYNHSFLRGLGELKFFDEDGIIGRKSQTFLEDGYIFAPYIPTEFKPRRSMMNRYAQRIVNNSFYGTVTIDGA